MNNFKTKLTVDQVEETVKKSVAAHLIIDIEKVKNDSHFQRDFDTDSLDIAELTMNYDDMYGISISDEDVNNIKTIQDLIDYVKAIVESPAYQNWNPNEPN